MPIGASVAWCAATTAQAASAARSPGKQSAAAKRRTQAEFVGRFRGVSDMSAPPGRVVRGVQRALLTNAAASRVDVALRAAISRWVTSWDVPSAARRDSHAAGSRPFALNTGATAGAVRNLMSAFAGSGSFAFVPAAVAKDVVSWISAGNGPTSSAPA